jgi:hypothetical protein
LAVGERGSDGNGGADVSEARGTFARYPQYDLTWAVDDADEPTEVTVFVDGDEENWDAALTNWLTIDVEHAVPLDETL